MPGNPANGPKEIDMTESAFNGTRVVRSRSAIAGGISVLAALPLAILCAVVFGGGDAVVVHVALGAGMVLMLLATNDFQMPAAITWIGRVGMAALGAIFLLQAAAEALQWPALLQLAYGDPTIQLIEKVSGYPILLWFAGLLLNDSRGKSQVFGGLVLAAIVASELYSLWLVLNGGAPDIMLRALYLPLFIWLALEGREPRYDS
jgi:hypothetical protein